MKNFIYLLIAFILFSFSDKRKNGVLKFSKEVFPNEVGDHWTYRFNGYGSSGHDSIRVDIIGKLRLQNGENAKIWLYSFPNGTDTNYVATKKDTVIFFNKNAAGCDSCTTTLPTEKTRYIFPLRINKSWVAKIEYADTLKVISASTISVPCGNLPNTFMLVNMPNRSHFIGNFRKTDTTWITPHIGISKNFQREYQMGQALGNGTWELLSYNIH